MVALRTAGFGLAFGLLAIVWSGVAPAAPSGAVIAVVQSSQADGATGTRTLSVEAPVYSGDKIITGAIGEAQIKFRDNTKLVVGPNSMMVIDAFVFNDNNTARQVSINAVRGAFRFITGNSPKDAYTINTPTATIGVRGTEFDFNVDRGDGQTALVMFGGMTRICPKTLSDGSPNKSRRECVEARSACGMTIIPSGGSVRQLKASEERNVMINQDFRYIRDQERLLADFRVNTATCGNTYVDMTRSGSAQSTPPPPTGGPVAPPPHCPPPPPPCGFGGYEHTEFHAQTGEGSGDSRGHSPGFR